MEWVGVKERLPDKAGWYLVYRTKPHRLLERITIMQKGDIIQFAWNPFFNEPSSLDEFTIQRVIKQDENGLYVDMWDRQTGSYKLMLSDLQEWFDCYAGEVKPISIVEENVQLSLSM